MAKKKIEPKRILKINLFEGDPIELEIGKAIELHTQQPAIYIEKMKETGKVVVLDISSLIDSSPN